MASFAAIILVCLSTMEVADCNERTALDVRSVEVDNELGCYSGWQEVIARSPRGADVGGDTYVKTLCERMRPREDKTKAPPPSSGSPPQPG